jgi:hypothetical protein
MSFFLNTHFGVAIVKDCSCPDTKKKLARPNSLSDYEQMAEAIRNLKKCGDNPDMQAMRGTGGGQELPDIRASWPFLDCSVFQD